MTDLEDFSISFQRIVGKSDSTDEVQRRLKSKLHSGQRQILDEYFEQKKLRQQRTVRRALTSRQIAQFRYQKRHPKHTITFDKKGRLLLRNSKGKFVNIPKYLKEISPERNDLILRSRFIHA